MAELSLWFRLAFGLIVALQIPFLGWLTLRVLAIERDIVVLQGRQNARDAECTARLAWLQRIDTKLDTTGEGVARIEGALAGRPNSKN